MTYKVIALLGYPEMARVMDGDNSHGRNDETEIARVLNEAEEQGWKFEALIPKLPNSNMTGALLHRED